MPNWCMTSYTIVGEKKDVEKIHVAVMNHPVKEKSDKDWQGNILNALGVSYDALENRSVRGFLYDEEYLGDIGDGQAQLRIVFNEAWSRTEFAEVLQELFPDINIYWMAEEPGCDIYQTNDADGDYYPERFYVDTCIGGDYQSEYFTTEEEVYEWLSQISDCKCKADVDAFNENRRKADTDEFISIHEFELEE